MPFPNMAILSRLWYNDDESQLASPATWNTMNSYPPELLVQLAPVMFVAGLDVHPPEPEPPAPSDSPAPAHPAQDPFTVLTLRLRDALLSQRTTAIWQPDKSKTFQTVLVEKVCSLLLLAILSSYVKHPRTSVFHPAKSHFLKTHTVLCIPHSLH
jgi:hypothetical protein